MHRLLGRHSEASQMPISMMAILGGRSRRRSEAGVAASGARDTLYLHGDDVGEGRAGGDEVVVRVAQPTVVPARCPRPLCQPQRRRLPRRRRHGSSARTCARTAAEESGEGNLRDQNKHNLFWNPKLVIPMETCSKGFTRVTLPVCLDFDFLVATRPPTYH